MGSINSLTGNLNVDFNSLRDVANGTYNKGEITVILKHGRFAFDKINNHVKKTEENVYVCVPMRNTRTNAAVFKAILEHYGRNDTLVRQVKDANLADCEQLLDGFSNPFIKKAFEFLISNDLKDGKPLSRDEMKLLFNMLDEVDRDLASARDNLVPPTFENYNGNERMQRLRDVHAFKTTGQFRDGREQQIMHDIKGFRATNANSQKRNVIMAVSENQRRANPGAGANANPVNRQLGNTGLNQLLEEAAPAKPEGQKIFDELIAGVTSADGRIEKGRFAKEKLTSFAQKLYGERGYKEATTYSCSLNSAIGTIGEQIDRKFTEQKRPEDAISGITVLQNEFDKFYEQLEMLEKDSSAEGKADRQKLIADFKEAQMAKSPALRNDLRCAKAMGRVFAYKCQRVNSAEYGKDYLENTLKDMFSQLFGKYAQNSNDGAREALQTVLQDMPRLANLFREAAVDRTKRDRAATQFWEAFQKCLNFQIKSEKNTPPADNDWSAHKKDGLFREFLARVFSQTPDVKPPAEKAAKNLGNLHQVSYVNANAVERGNAEGNEQRGRP